MNNPLYKVGLWFLQRAPERGAMGLAQYADAFYYYSRTAAN